MPRLFRKGSSKSEQKSSGETSGRLEPQPATMSGFSGYSQYSSPPQAQQQSYQPPAGSWDAFQSYNGMQHAIHELEGGVPAYPRPQPGLAPAGPPPAPYQVPANTPGPTNQLHAAAFSPGVPPQYQNGSPFAPVSPMLPHANIASGPSYVEKPPLRPVQPASSSPRPLEQPSLAPTSVRNGSEDKPSIRKILVLDGGGVRGLSEVLLLEQIMVRLSRERGCPERQLIEPWQEFDMICGTSSGGLLAIMLGRLRMSIDQVKKAYLELSATIFTQQKTVAKMATRTYDLYDANRRFKAEPFEDAIRNILLEHGFADDTYLYDDNADDQACKVFVCAVTRFASAQRLRSYVNDREIDSLLHKCKIWEAIRATYAASTFFPSIKIDDIEFLDGGFRYNNPIELAKVEARGVYGNEPQMFISLGAGQGIPPDLTGDAEHVADILKELIHQTEESNLRFFRDHEDLVQNNRLFRFNVTHGLREIGLEEYERLDEIKARTLAYLTDDVSVRANLANCSRVLREGGQRLHILAGAELKAHYEHLAASTVDAAWCFHCRQGIKFNEPAMCCLEDNISMHSRCQNAHDFSHSNKLIPVTYARWQAGSKTYAELGQCTHCARRVKCRISCTVCAWSTCESCSARDPDRLLAKQHLQHFPQHREYVVLVNPFTKCAVIDLGDRSCPCRTVADVIGQCGRCYDMIRVNDSVYTCSTCHNEYGASRRICSKCISEEDPDHRSKHQFTKIALKYDRSLEQQGKDEIQEERHCNDCNLRLANLELVNHPHPNVEVHMNSAAIEARRRKTVRNCTFHAELDPGRRAPTIPVKGPFCDFCLSTIAFEEWTGWCSICNELFCQTCMASQRHYHRHQPLLNMRYRKRQLGQPNINQTRCDICGISAFASVFAGVECQNCRNMHYCAACITKASNGEVRIPNGGWHGCPEPSNWLWYSWQ